MQENKKEEQAIEGLLSQIDQEQMSEQQQEQLEEYILKGYHIIYDESDAVLEMATKTSPNKLDGIANAGFAVAQRIDMSQTQKKKPPYPDEIKVAGGAHLVNKIMEYAEQAGRARFDPTEKQAALEKSFKKYIDYGIKHRFIDPVELAKGLEQVQPGIINKILVDAEDKQSTIGGEGQQPMPQQGQQPMPQQGQQPMPQQGQQPMPQQDQQGQQPQAPQQPSGLLTKPTALQQMQQGGM